MAINTYDLILLFKAPLLLNSTNGLRKNRIPPSKWIWTLVVPLKKPSKIKTVDDGVKIVDKGRTWWWALEEERDADVRRHRKGHYIDYFIMGW